MKNLYLLLFCLAIGTLQAQKTANLVLFTDQGEPFYAYINSVKQNESASGNVKISNFPAEFARLRIEFEDEELGSFDKNIMLQFGYETTAIVKQHKKGHYVIRPFGEPVPVASAPSRTDDQPVIIYHNEPYETETNHRPEHVVVEDVYEEPVIHNDEVELTETTIQSETRAPNGQSGGAHMGVNVDGVGIYMGVDIHEPGTTSTDERVSHTTTTTTTTTTTRQPSYERPTRPVVEPSVERPVYEEVIIEEPLVPGYSGPVGCSGYLMSDHQFEAAKKSISTKTFEDDKVTLAKQISGSNCLTTQQVMGIMDLFTFEQSKLSWAKMAYDRTHDIGNYWMLNDGFTFSSSIDELNDFIESRR